MGIWRGAVRRGSASRRRHVPWQKSCATAPTPTPTPPPCPGPAGRVGVKWSGCIARIRLWLRLPHGCQFLLSIVSASRASPGASGLCIPALAPGCSLALWTLQGYAYIPVSGHSQWCCCWPHSAPRGWAEIGPQVETPSGFRSG